MKCNNCGYEVSENAKFCGGCGREIIRLPKAQNENLCPKCGSALVENSAFCSNCGHRLEENQTPIIDNTICCPNCGKAIEADSTFCGECGLLLNGYNAPPTAPMPTAEQYAQYAPKKKGGKTWVIALLIVAVIACAGAAYYKINYLDNQDNFVNKNASNTEAEATEKNTDFEALKTEEKEMEPTAEKFFEEDTKQEEDYLFPSDKEYITKSDLDGKTKEEVALIRNEIYARHGYIFKSEVYKEYFEEKDWYVPNKNFNEGVFNKIEKENKDFIVEYEEKRGWR